MWSQSLSNTDDFYTISSQFLSTNGTFEFIAFVTLIALVALVSSFVLKSLKET